MPRNVFLDISKLEKREKDHIKTVIERAEWIPGQVKLFTFSELTEHSLSRPGSH